MTLCLAQSIVDRDGKFVVHDQVRKYVDWKEKGYLSATGECFDIGNATREALGIWEETMKDVRDANTVEMKHYQGLVDQALNREASNSRSQCPFPLLKHVPQSSCGNGSLMRCAPVPLIYHCSPEIAQEYAAQASVPTHPHPTCVQACQIYTHLISRMMDSNPMKSQMDIWDALQAFVGGKDERFGHTTQALHDTFSKYAYLKDFQNAHDHDIESSGYVVHTLEAALWAFFSTTTFKQGALKVVNLGNDADTVGAVYGGLAGAWYGVEAIPEEWLSGLQAKSILDKVVEGVVTLVAKGGYTK